MEGFLLLLLVIVVFVGKCYYDKNERITSSHTLALLSQDFVILASFLHELQQTQDKDAKKSQDNAQEAIELHGAKGEAEVMAKIAYAKPLAVYGGVHVYPHARDKHHEIDHILVFPECILLVETKNLSCHGKWIQRSEYDRPNEWIHEGRHGTKAIRNPFYQAKIARASLRDALERVDLHVPTWSIVLYPDGANVDVARTAEAWHGRFSETTRLTNEARAKAPQNTPVTVILEFMTLLAKNGVYPKFFDDKGLIQAVQTTLGEGEVSAQAHRLDRTPLTDDEIHDAVERVCYNKVGQVHELATPRDEFRTIFLSILQNTDTDHVKHYPARCRGFFAQTWTGRDGRTY